MENTTEIAIALRRIARGIDALADAVGSVSGDVLMRQMQVIRAWGDRGLTREETSALFRDNGFAPQTSGGWARSEWIESRDDGLRYLTPRSLQLLRQEG